MGRLIARWGASLRIARRDATRHRGRTALVLAMIALPVLGAVFLATVIRSGAPGPEARASIELGPGAQASIRSGGCVPYLQMPDGGGGGCTGTQVPDLTSEQLADLLPDGLRLVEEQGTMVSVGTADRLAGMQWTQQLDAEALPEIYVVDDGALPTAPGEVALHPRLAHRLDVGVGDAVELTAGETSLDARVVGILRTRNVPMAEALTVEGTFPSAAPSRWLVLGDAPLTWDDVLALNEVGAEVMSRDVILHPPPRSAVPAYETFDVGSPANLGTVGIVAAIAAIGLLEVVLLIGPAFAVGARRSTRQLALLAASGGAPTDMRRVVLASGLVLGLAAGIVGSALGLLGGAALYAVAVATGSGSMPNLVLPWPEAAAAVVLATLLGLAASWVPARGAARSDVTAALAGRRAEARPRRAVPWVGVSIAVLGLVGAVVGAVTTQVVALVVGVVVLEIGLVMAVGGVVTLVGRSAGRLGLAGRIAARDAARQRGRTAPAVAAVLAAIAGATAGAMYFSADRAREEAAWEPQFGIGTVALTSGTPDGSPLTSERVAADLAVLGRHVPLADVANVHTLEMPREDDAAAEYPGHVFASPQIAPEHVCPLFNFALPPTSAEREQYADDPRCDDHPGWSSGGTWTSAGGSGTVVDDGSAAALWGLPGSDDAAAALARGEVLVPDERYVWEDGSAHLTVSTYDYATGVSRDIELEIPAHVVDWHRYALVLPTSAVEARDDIVAVLSGAIAQPVAPPTQAQVDAANADLGEIGVATLDVQEAYSSQVGLILLAVVGVAAIIGLGATWMSVGLAAAESRPDLATLAAVGASPRTRRRVAGAQAGIIAVLGVALGVLTGVLLGWVLVTWQASNVENLYDDRGAWLLVWPWPALAAIALGIPALAVAGAWLTTRSRLPLVRRLAQ
ncbi:protein of unknown function DUF214 [Beutenbergia cavernae DSM 12333]|uniref:ABC3 transporter permease C-terminal domain-containing protein n=1 Tax=Beutenbergia cavernae (strain ATCC BAA-8 / DSM 12333 / CCUG 43141 / JCM 11478 / NBRC 16432 / NCIMB 13614 / HKI 0122) TaxID=471853 RepID=C5C0M3_BEUC1|nr:ABC transporter permease [Beutenbergia cavernae]ACQ81419.1 protein of unknown function DUF214 [Beutenbergia cavernae DSM 12333]